MRERQHLPSAAAPAQLEVTMNETITINGREYAPVDTMPNVGEQADLGVRIVVLQRGWVVVGHARRFGPRVTVSKCAVVRRWGTTKGLGQLAVDGPQSETVLDDCHDVECLESEVVLSMRCDHAKWGSRV